MPEPTTVGSGLRHWRRGAVEQDSLPPLSDDERAREQMEERRENALSAFARRVPQQFAHAHTERPDMLAWATRYAQDSRTCPWLLLSGPTGTGKTYLGFAAIRAVAETGTPHSMWRATNSADLYGSLRRRSFSEAEDELADHARVPLLMLDDLGAANLTGWTEEITYRLINRRYEHCAPMIITTNVAPDYLKGVIGERTTSRLLQMSTEVLVKGDDRRLRPPG